MAEWVDHWLLCWDVNLADSATRASLELPYSLVFGEAQKSGVTIKALN
ncbi:MAG: hypothetical protein J6U73_02185 [Alistipes sp.]|nr:hypothetical protein [Alistipes sp.]